MSLPIATLAAILGVVNEATYGPGTNVLIQDEFVGDDGTLLPDHTPDIAQGRPWVSYEGGYKIEGNAAVRNGSGAAVSLIWTGQRDSTVAVTQVTDDGNRTHAVLLRARDNHNYLYGFIHGGYLEIRKVVNDNDDLLAHVAQADIVGTPYRLIFTAHGTFLRLSVEGGPVVETLSDLFLDALNVGLATSYNDPIASHFLCTRP